MTSAGYPNWWVLHELQKLKGEKLLQGGSGSRGIVLGRVKNVGDSTPEMMARIRPGDIVVAVAPRPPELNDYCGTAAALITDKGGMTSYAAVFAVSRGKPAVVGTKEATHVLKDRKKSSLMGQRELSMPLMKRNLIQKQL